MNAVEFALERLKVEEGYSPRVYKDHLGYDTICFGTLLPITERERKSYNIAEAHPGKLSRLQCEQLLAGRFGRYTVELEDALPWVREAPECVRAALYDCSYQLGLQRLRGFRKTLAHLEAGSWMEAGDELLDSRYARQTPGRANRNAWLLRQGEGPLPESVIHLYREAADGS